jgi:hypothetical protein
MSDEIAHEVVVSSLLDLQARLRGADDQSADQPQDVVTVLEATPIFVNMPDDARLPAPPRAVSVVEDELTVQVEAAESHPLVVLPDLEERHVSPVTPLHPVSTAPADGRLASLTERLARLELELDGVIGRIERVDPDRIERLEAVHDELGAGQEGLKAAIDSHFTKLQRSIDERLHGTER